jgi:hypothetical protein
VNRKPRRFNPVIQERPSTPGGARSSSAGACAICRDPIPAGRLAEVGLKGLADGPLCRDCLVQLSVELLAGR